MNLSMWQDTLQTIVNSAVLIAVINYFLESWRERKKFTFEKLHVERAKVIKTLYQKLVTVHKLFLALLEEQPDDYGRGALKLKLGVNYDVLFKAFQDCYEYYLNNDLYFSKPLSQKIWSVLEELTASINSFRLIGKAHVNPCHARDRAKEGALVNIPPLLESIREEFRKLIGVK